MKTNTEEIKNIRTRIAPSPTGYPHIGNLRAFLFPFLAAKHYGGSFVLRIEDTDKKREVEGGVAKLIEIMRAYDMIPDEGPTFGGEYGPYIQSERREIYKKHAEELVENGSAYYCFCTAERLEKMREEQTAKGMTQTRYDGLCRKLDKDEAKSRVEAGESHVIRLKVPTTGVCEFRDFSFGKVQVPYKSIDDQVLLKSDGLPTYHFGVVVDDHLMKITHVFRGEEYLSSTPKDILMYEAFGWEIPGWVHMPMVVGENGKKFGKRSGALPALEYLEAGFLVDAVLNYISLLGWNPGDNRTYLTREELYESFSLERMQKSPARFDFEKFKWLNGEHIRALEIGKLTEIFLNWLEKYGNNKELHSFLSNDEFLSAKIALVQERAKTLVEIVEQIEFFYKVPTAEQYAEANKEVPKGIKEMLDELIDHHVLSDIEDQEEWEKGIREIAERFEAKAGDVFMQVRLAIVGSRFSPPLRESMAILGKEEVLKRLHAYSVS